MDLKPLCYLVHCWHHILMLFHFGRMYSFRNRNCYLNCYCNQKIFHFGRVLQNLCSHSLPHCWIGFRFGVDGRQVCLHYCESRPHWSWYQSLSLRVFLFGRVCCVLGSYNIFYNIFGYCTVYFTLGGCFVLVMSNAFGGGVVTPLSLELAQWYCWEGLFRLVAFSRAHH